MTVTRWGEGEASPDSVLLPSGRTVLPDLRKAVYVVQWKDGKTSEIKKQTIGLIVNRGDRISCHVVGGGGVGDPFSRDPIAVCNDYLNGLVSLQSAREEYGVAIDPVVRRQLT